VKFKYSQFRSIAFFRDAKIKGKLDLRDAIFKDEVNFLDIKTNVSNRETARIIKHSFEQQDNIIEANKFYALEMQKQEESLKWRKSFLDKLIFTFHQLSSNHSQDWMLVLLWILNITVLYKISPNITSTASNDIVIFLMTSIITIGIFLINVNKLFCYHILHNYKVILSIIFLYLFNNSNINFDTISNNINPFSIMTTQTITFSELIYKIIIAYLLYQFIISIRQNTRRK